MKTEKIIKLLAAEHNVLINENDPIFSIILLNKIILNEYISEISKELDNAMTTIAIKEEYTLKKAKNLHNIIHANNKNELERLFRKLSSELLNNQSRIVNNSISNKNDDKYTLFHLIITSLMSLLAGGFFIFMGLKITL